MVFGLWPKEKEEVLSVCKYHILKNFLNSQYMLLLVCFHYVLLQVHREKEVALTTEQKQIHEEEQVLEIYCCRRRMRRQDKKESLLLVMLNMPPCGFY